MTIFRTPVSLLVMILLHGTVLAQSYPGKPVRGTVRLNAFHESGSIVIEVGDDGGGQEVHGPAGGLGAVAPVDLLAVHEIHLPL